MFFFAVVEDVVIELTREGVLCELLYADDFILMSETIEELRNKFRKWKEVFDSKGLKVILMETKVMVIGGITKDVLSKHKFDPCGICRWREDANSVLCVQCGKWINDRCAWVKTGDKFFTKFRLQAI